MAVSEIVQFWYNTKVRLLAIIIQFLNKVCSISKPASRSVGRPFNDLYTYVIAQFLSVKQTECSYVNCRLAYDVIVFQN